MNLPAGFALMVALAVPAGEPALALAAPAVQRPATISEIGQFHAERRGRAFWFAEDNAGVALLALIEQASFDIGKTKLYELVGSGDLEAIRIGRRTLILQTSIDALINRLRSPPPNLTANAEGTAIHPRDGNAHPYDRSAPISVDPKHARLSRNQSSIQVRGELPERAQC